MSDFIEKLKKRVEGNLKAIADIDWVQEAKYMTALEKRPRTPQPEFNATRKKMERNAQYSGPATPPTEEEIFQLLSGMTKGPAHKFDASSKLDRSQVVDGGTHDEMDLMKAWAQLAFPRALLEGSEWRDQVAREPRLPPSRIDEAVARDTPYDATWSDLKLPKWKSASARKRR